MKASSHLNQFVASREHMKTRINLKKQTRLIRESGIKIARGGIKRGMRTDRVIETVDVRKESEAQILERRISPAIRFLEFMIFEESFGDSIVVGVALGRKGLRNIKFSQKLREVSRRRHIGNKILQNKKSPLSVFFHSYLC